MGTFWDLLLPALWLRTVAAENNYFFLERPRLMPASTETYSRMDPEILSGPAHFWQPVSDPEATQGLRDVL